MEKRHIIGKLEIKHLYCPSRFLSDVELKKMQNELIYINEKSGANIVNRILDPHIAHDELKEIFDKAIVGICLREGEPWAFLISPILSSLDKAVIHAGLIIAHKNPGVDLISLLGMGNFKVGYDELGDCYITNITSTPSIIESVCHMVPGSWPSPDVSLKKVPKGYKDVIKILKEDYMDKNFPDADKLQIDYRRFILTSNSQEMGFVTDFYKISRSDDYRYLSFCQSWINYNKEEDIIQVGEVNFLKSLRMSYLLWRLRKDLKVIEENWSVEKREESEKVKKAA